MVKKIGWLFRFRFAGDMDHRRSLTDYVFSLLGCIVSWKASLQPTVTFSMAQAEYMALTKVVKEAIWLVILVWFKM